jgi:hypothetical protein
MWSGPLDPQTFRRAIKVYIDKPRTLEALSDAITREIQAIPLAMLQRAMDNFSARLQQCLYNNDRHFHDVILQK